MTETTSSANVSDSGSSTPTAASANVESGWLRAKSGDVYQVAEVVRNLALRDQSKGLSAGEKSMFVKARSVLVSELSFALDVSEDEALAKVEAQLAPVD